MQGSDEPPAAELFFPPADEIRDLVVGALGGTAMFAAKFRENAARALLLPRRQPGRRTPLWLQRRKSADLLSVAARYDQFPIILETFRECLKDVFDLEGLKTILGDVASRKIRLHEVRTSSPSPFAASLMYGFTANFLYNGDAPLAERKAATLSLDLKQLRELLGDAEMRQLLDGDVIQQLSLELQRQTGLRGWRDADGLHDLLRLLGDLDAEEVANRRFREDGNQDGETDTTANADGDADGEEKKNKPADEIQGLPELQQLPELQELIEQKRVLPFQVANGTRYLCHRRRRHVPRCARSRAAARCAVGFSRRSGRSDARADRKVRANAWTVSCRRRRGSLGTGNRTHPANAANLAGRESRRRR